MVPTQDRDDECASGCELNPACRQCTGACLFSRVSSEVLPLDRTSRAEAWSEGGSHCFEAFALHGHEGERAITVGATAAVVREKVQHRHDDNEECDIGGTAASWSGVQRPEVAAAAGTVPNARASVVAVRRLSRACGLTR